MASGSLTPDSWSVDFVEGIYSAEDLAPIPGTRWLVTSGMAGPDCQGHLYAVDTERLEATEIYPERGGTQSATEAYGEHPPPDLEDFSAVGVGLRPGDGRGPHALHREPWRPLDDRGVLDRCRGRDPERHLDRRHPLRGGRARERGGVRTPATSRSGTRGPVGRTSQGRSAARPTASTPPPTAGGASSTLWATKRFVRVSRGGASVDRQEFEVPILPDNVKWAPSGRVLITGQESDAQAVLDGVHGGATFDVPLRVIAIDPETLEYEELFRFQDPGGFGTAATALEVGDAIWVSSARSERIARFRRR